MSRKHERSERGSATVLAAGLLGVLLCLGLAALLLASAVIASHRARAAADLAALAAAGAVLRGQADGAVCQVAAAVARDNSARLASCARDGSSVRVTVTVRPAVGRLGDATARARSGPPPAGAAAVTTGPRLR